MRSACLSVVLAGLIAGAAQAAEPTPARAAEEKPAAEKDIEPIDADFLEFLGSLDTEDDDWREFLESRPINDAARPEPKQEKVKKP